jgi:cupin superfamily acireductone dioxygenase involved in methionine salvage
LHYRPAVGRLRLKFASEGERTHALELLSSFVEGGTFFDVAYADHSYELRLERLPAWEDDLIKIKTGIKERFDPGMVMNPLAKL